MKYIVVLGDGMADEPIAEIGGKTPLAYAKTPTMDVLAKKSEIGLAHTIPEGMKPGSDTANLAVLGYDPKKYYTGRSPLEALSIGVPMKDTDIAIRCNIVTVSDDDLPYEEKTIIDHSSSEISTKDAAVLMEAIQKEMNDEIYQYYVGTSDRHLTIWDKGEVVELTPPHDVLGKKIGQYLPQDAKLREMMKRSYDILNNHPLNVERAKKGLNKANSIWFWGAGTKPILDSFEGKFHKKGAMISAVDLLKGIAVGAEMTNIDVEGADGTLETNCTDIGLLTGSPDGCQGGSKLSRIFDNRRDDLLARHVDHRLCLDVDGLGICLILNLGAGFQLGPGVHAKFFKELDRFLGPDCLDRIDTRFQVRESTALCLFNPFLRITISAENDTAVLCKQTLDDIMDCAVKIIAVFQFVRSLFKRFCHDRVEHDVRG